MPETPAEADTIAVALADIARRPRHEWSACARDRFGNDAALVAQALAWLHAGHEGTHRDAPVLGHDRERYKLGALLDHGATASVWLAFDRKLGRNVALKLFRRDAPPLATADRDALAHILAEARAACEVQSDHVVRVLDVHDTDPAYIVMELIGERSPETGELVPGASAASCRPRDLEEAVAWARDVARGVHDAHLRNVFHRDLKPHNVLVTPISRRAKIADFGLAVRSSANGEGGRHAPIAGTPSFMAPEQARGLPVVLDPQDPEDRAVLVGADVWGVGAVAYELLAGRPPWQATAELDAWEVALTSARPSALERTTHGARIPRRLRRVIERALAPDRHARYATAGELADELDAFLARRPTSFERARVVRAALWCRRNPQLALTALLAVGLASSTAFAYAIARDVREQRNALATDIARARDENAELAARKQEIRTELAAAEANLAAKTATLEQTRTALADVRLEYDALVDAKARALRDADAITRRLSEQLATTRQERDQARVAQKMYEQFWSRGRGEAQESARERDDAERDRDTARDERDQALRERDAALAARARAEHERDAARLERDTAEAIRRRLEIDVARLAAELANALRAATRVAVDAPADAAP